MLARHGDVGNFFQKRHVAARHTTRKKRPRHTVFVCLFANIIQNRPPAHRKRPRHTVFVCLFADIIQNHPPAHRTCCQRRRRGAVSFPIMSKKAFLAKVNVAAAMLFKKIIYLSWSTHTALTNHALKNEGRSQCDRSSRRLALLCLRGSHHLSH